MKIEVQAESSLIIRHIEKYFTDIVFNQQITEDTHFIVSEKFFFRNSSRCSLSIVLSSTDSYQTLIHAVGSGGGQGLIFRYDWGSAKSYEHDIIKMLDQYQIKYKVLSE
jgi:hypothetical protein